MNATELKLDYFKIYEVENRRVQITVPVQGQFDPAPKIIELMVLAYFANAASKNDEPYYDKQAHLTFYTVYQQVPEPTRLVVAQDQFGNHQLVTGNVFGFLAPAQKFEAGSSLAEELDHFKVYTVLEHQPVNQKANLSDQFGAGGVAIMGPSFFAVPVMKWRPGKVYGIHNKTAHLLIYSITPQPMERGILVEDQFATYPLTVVRSVGLAVPCLKQSWKPA